MKALAEGGVASAALNAANEIAVEAFLSRQIGFMAIAQVVDSVLNGLPNRSAHALEDVIEADAARASRRCRIHRASGRRRPPHGTRRPVRRL